jgi:DNA polymerase (family X)
MSNDEIVEILELTAKLLDLHEGDAFKIKSLSAANYTLSRYNDRLLATMTLNELTQLPAVGKGAATKVVEIIETGHLQDLDELMAQTPPGVIDMFKIKGIGPKKIGQIWRGLSIDNIPELQIACENGQIAALKGFGESTQQKILESLAFIQSQAGKLRMNKAAALAHTLLRSLQNVFEKVVIVGEVTRYDEVVSVIQFLVASREALQDIAKIRSIAALQQNEKESSPTVWRGKAIEIEILIEIIFVKPESFESQQFIHNSSEAHLAFRGKDGHTLLKIAKTNAIQNDTEIYEKAALPYIVVERRIGADEFEWAEKYQNEDLVTWAALRGSLHNHSKYSDGKNTLSEMAERCQSLGFEYFGIADHSQAANYANGLTPERVYEQHTEIDHLNAQMKPFKILKGIEADILGDGSLDYTNEVLATFDYVVASVHSNLTMNLEKAMARLTKAIENPYTTILGHLTGRLLLSREGYPVDHRTIIDACAANKVVIEINASPWRLDIDWRWIHYCMEKGVMLSINPDAHEVAGFLDMHYGVAVARKGGLTKAMTFNALSLADIEKYLQK